MTIAVPHLAPYGVSGVEKYELRRQRHTVQPRRLWLCSRATFRLCIGVRLCRLYHLPVPPAAITAAGLARRGAFLRRARAFFMARTVPVLAPKPPPTSAFPPFLNE